MAINWNAGLDEIKQSGNVMGQGLAQLTQQQTAQGNRMVALEGQRQAVVAQNAKQKRADSQQMFDNVLAAGDTFAKIKMKSDELAQKKITDGRATEEWNQRQTEYKQQQRDREVNADAIVSENDKTKQVDVPVVLIDPIEKARYISSKQAIENQKKNLAWSEESHTLDIAGKKQTIAASVADTEYKQDTFAETKRHNAKMEKDQDIAIARDESKEARSALNEIAKVASTPNAIYTLNETPETIAANKTAKTEIEGLVNSLDNTRTTRIKLFEAAKVVPKSAKPTREDYIALNTAIEKLPDNDPGKANLNRLYHSLLFSGKEPGMAAGGFTAGEYSMMAGKSGADAIAYLSTLGVNGETLLDKFSRSTETGLVREGKLISLGQKLDEDEAKAKAEIASKLNSNNGLPTIDKGQRDGMLYKMVPPNLRGNEEGKISPKAFSDTPYQQQILNIYGDSAKDINITRAMQKDAMNSHPEEVAKSLFTEAMKWKPSVKLAPEDESRVVNQHQLLVQGIQARTQLASNPAPTGYVTKPPDSGKYVIIPSANGGSEPAVNSSGVPILISNPYGNKQPKPPQQSKVKSTSFNRRQ
jgi:hypothetical protein